MAILKERRDMAILMERWVMSILRELRYMVILGERGDMSIRERME